LAADATGSRWSGARFHQEVESMRIGVPREIKNHEYRVGLTPASVRELVAQGHEVVVESGAGAGIGMDDADYRRCGASIGSVAAEVYAAAEMIVKVKEPQAANCRCCAGAAAVHLPAPGARPGADAATARGGRGRDRLRDGHRPAAACRCSRR
jgi:hypothetical protein